MSNPVNPSGPVSWEGTLASSAATIDASKQTRNPITAMRWRRRGLVWGGRALLLVVVLGGWQLCTMGKHPVVDPFFFGQPTGIWHRLIKYFADGTAFGSYWDQIYTTLKEAVLGFLIGTVARIVVGVALGSSRLLSDVFGPYIKVVNAIPRIVLGSIFIVAFGIGILPKILLAAVLVFFVVFFNAFQGVREVDRNIIANARVLGAKPLDIVRHVTVPSALTWIIASLHSAFGFAIVGALVAEVLGSQKGLGLVIKTAQGTFDPNGVFAVMATVAVITLGAEFLITKLEHRLLFFNDTATTEISAI